MAETSYFCARQRQFVLRNELNCETRSPPANEKETIALKYWTSNESCDENLNQKHKKPSDSKSGASVIPFQTTQVSSILPISQTNRDGEDFGLLILKNGRAGGIRTHDLTHPKRTRYQAALQPDFSENIRI